jgi:LysM repeat protein
MRQRWLIILSILLNIVLVAVFISRARHTPPPAVTEPAAPATRITNDGRLRTQVVVRKQFFSWAEVESPQYPVYIARLREIGCPEQTIRDIVVADVNQLYARKRLSEVVTPDQQWWRSDPDTNVVQVANARIQALDLERRAMLASLLGPNWEAGNPDSAVVALNGPLLGELSPQVQQAVQDILARDQVRSREYYDAQQKAGKPADPVEVARLEQQTRDELAKLLTPAQLEEFLLRYSSAANDLREQLKGFAVTPDEFRSLFHLRDPIYQQLQAITGTDPASTTRRNQLMKQLDTAFQSVLGQDRYQAYKLSQDPAYRDAVAVAQQNGASSTVLQNLYKLNQAARQEMDRINNDPNLTPEQKAERLNQLAQQQKALSDELLGKAQPQPPPLPTPPVQSQIHAFSPGETIDQIASRYGVTPMAILNANTNLDINHLRSGTPIVIPHWP